MIYFRLSADADEFLTIAKFRALRKLWARVEETCKLTPKPAYVAAETAWRMMTKRDPNVNMVTAGHYLFRSHREQHRQALGSSSFAQREDDCLRRIGSAATGPAGKMDADDAGGATHRTFTE